MGKYAGWLGGTVLVVLAGCSTTVAPGKTRWPLFQKTATASVQRGRYWHFVEGLRPAGPHAALYLWAALPIDRPGQQVKIERIYPPPTQIVEDTVNGNRIAVWRRPRLTRDRFLCFYQFEVAVDEVRAAPDFDRPVVYVKSRLDYRRYTRSEPGLEITPELKQQAQEIAAAESHPGRKALALYHWVLDQMSYEYPDEKARGAARSFPRRKGDCGEYSAVFVALCRAVGIPARTVTGVWMTRGGHQWAEILLPPAGWVPVDPTMAQLMEPGRPSPIMSPDEIKNFARSCGIPDRDRDYFFGNLYPNRLMVFVGNNVEVRPRQGGTKIFRTLQPGGSQAVPRALLFSKMKSRPFSAGFYLWGDRCDRYREARRRAREEMASQFLQAREYARARKAFLAKLRRNPRQAPDWLNLGQAYLGREEWPRALASFRRVADARGDSFKPVCQVWAYNLSGFCYDVLQRRKDAVRSYQEALDTGVDHKGSLAFARKGLKEPLR